MQDVVDGARGPSDCGVARQSIATDSDDPIDESTNCGIDRIVKAWRALCWPMTDLSEYSSITSRSRDRAEMKDNAHSRSQGAMIKGGSGPRHSLPRHPPFTGRDAVMLPLGAHMD
jgi:hypothetical protein